MRCCGGVGFRRGKGQRRDRARLKLVENDGDKPFGTGTSRVGTRYLQERQDQFAQERCGTDYADLGGQVHDRVGAKEQVAALRLLQVCHFVEDAGRHEYGTFRRNDEVAALGFQPERTTHDLEKLRAVVRVERKGSAGGLCSP